MMYYRPKRYCPDLVAEEGSALWGNTLSTALLHDRNRTIPFGLIVQCKSPNYVIEIWTYPFPLSMNRLHLIDLRLMSSPRKNCFQIHKCCFTSTCTFPGLLRKKMNAKEVSFLNTTPQQKLKILTWCPSASLS